MILSSLRRIDSEHVTLLFEDGSELPTTLGIVTELRLFAGKSLEEAQLNLIREKTAAASARERGLALLSSRPHSQKELRRKLLQKGIDPASAETALSWLADHGYLDDARYAAQVVRHYAAKGYGQQRITAELLRRGISRELWDEAFSEMPDTGSAVDRFLRSHLKNPEDPNEVRKLAAALQRRGFGWDEIRSGIERAKHPDEYDYGE